MNEDSLTLTCLMQEQGWPCAIFFSPVL